MGTTPFDYEQTLGHLMARTYRALANRLQTLFAQAGYNVTVEQWIFLVILSEHNGLFQKQLADITRKDKTSITRLVGGLEKRGLVARSADTADRRHKRVFITARGRQFRKLLKPLVLQNTLDAQHGIAPQRLEECKDVLRDVCNNITSS